MKKNNKILNIIIYKNYIYIIFIIININIKYLKINLNFYYLLFILIILILIILILITFIKINHYIILLFNLYYLYLTMEYIIYANHIIHQYF